MRSFEACPRPARYNRGRCWAQRSHGESGETLPGVSEAWTTGLEPWGSFRDLSLTVDVRMLEPPQRLHLCFPRATATALLPWTCPTWCSPKSFRSVSIPLEQCNLLSETPEVQDILPSRHFFLKKEEGKECLEYTTTEISKLKSATLGRGHRESLSRTS